MKKIPIAIGAVVFIGAAAAVSVLVLQGSLSGAARAARDYATLLSAHKVDAAKPAIGNLDATPVSVKVKKVHSSGKHATATLNWNWTFNKSNWNYSSSLELNKEKDKWIPDWKPSALFSSLDANSSLSMQRVQPKRADILGANGHVLMTESAVVDVGVSPQRATDVDGLSKQLGQLLNVDGNGLATRIKAAKPDAFVDVITLRQSDYDAIKPKLQPLPGTVFKQTTLPLAPTRQFASALLGRVGPVTAEIVNKSNGRYAAGDTGGLSGLQLQYDERLAGTTGITISQVHKDPKIAATQLFTVPSTPGQSVTTTLDTNTQEAADNALAGQTKPSSFVAIQASTGNVLAVSNGPDVGADDRALVGQYPPGSSFKVITTYALLQKGVTADQNVACPPTLTVDGKVFKNAENEAFGSAPFNVDFAKSCNTAFVSLAPKVPDSALPDAANAFNLGAKWNVGVNAFSGSIPKPTSQVQLAAAAFGQGNTLVSPIAMANVAAGVDSGNAHKPSIVTDPAPSQTTEIPTALDAPTIATLRTLMRQVVTSGTGTAVNNVAGGDVYGKTGTAEFGNANPPQSHAWFIGYQGDIAFAAFVEGGEFGGDTAAPIAAKFLSALAG